MTDVPARFEALAALGGIGRDAVHAQLAGAVRVVMHIRREGQGRVLHEIAVLRRDSAGLVRAQPAIVAGRPDGAGAAVLAHWLADRGEPVPW